MVLTLIQTQKWKYSANYSWEKLAVKFNNVALHCGPFESGTLEIFTANFLLKTITNFFRFRRVLSLKTKKMFSEKMLANQKLLNIERDRRKTLKKRDRKKVWKIVTAIINIFLLLLFLLGNIFGKT